jgi:hypothetical protein
MRSAEQDYRASLERSGIPDYMHDGIVLYLMHGIPPGSFLSAVLSNDLRKAVSRADETNMQLLSRYVIWFYNHAPASCWGSPERVDEWMRSRRPAEVSL